MHEVVELVFLFLVFPGVVFTTLLGLFLSWVVRRVSAAVQWRRGPPVTQPFWDVLKPDVSAPGVQQPLTLAPQESCRIRFRVIVNDFGSPPNLWPETAPFPPYLGPDVNQLIRQQAGEQGECIPPVGEPLDSGDTGEEIAFERK